MANLIPRSDGAVIAPAQVFTIIQKNATTLAKDAFRLKTSKNIREAITLYEQCRRFASPGDGLAKWKGNALLQDYANSIHPDANYDFDAALDACIDAYTAYALWFRNNVTDLAKNRKDENGDIVPVVHTFDGAGARLNAIIATVE